MTISLRKLALRNGNFAIRPTDDHESLLAQLRERRDELTKQIRLLEFYQTIQPNA